MLHIEAHINTLDALIEAYPVPEIPFSWEMPLFESAAALKGRILDETTDEVDEAAFEKFLAEYPRKHSEMMTYIYAEREMRRMKLENENVPDYSNRGPYAE